MNPTLLSSDRAATPDVQAQADQRGVRINRVGVRGVRYPILIDFANQAQPSIAEWELTVELAAEQRGTHMSRFMETLEDHAGQPLTGRGLITLLRSVRDRLDTPVAHARCRVPVFFERPAPISGLSARHVIDCRYEASNSEQTTNLVLGVRVPVTTLCPCSKEISEYGAHNQRGYVEIDARVNPGSDIGFADLIAAAEASGSAVIYPLLKRSDERHVTMQAYDSPTFVEDVVRTATLALASDTRILAFTVEAENHESIHDHSAVATVCWERS